MCKIYYLWIGSCNRQFIRVNHEESRSCWKLLTYLIISCISFPVFLKKKSRCDFLDCWVMRNFLEDFAFLLKRVQLALRYAIQFLVTFSKYSTRFTVLLEISSFCRILVDTDSNNRKFCNDTIFWKKVEISWDRYPLSLTLKSLISYPVKTKWFIRDFQFSAKSVNI